MGKKRRKARKQPIEPVDMEALANGTIPWSAKEFYKVADWYHALQQRPKDDWDLTERGVNLRDESGATTAIRFNSFHPFNQLSFHMMKRHNKDGKAGYHLWRFIEMGTFLTQHIAKLKQLGLARKSEDEPCDEVHPAVIQALCALPYTRKGENGRQTFDLDQVFAKAFELRREASDDEEPTKGE